MRILCEVFGLFDKRGASRGSTPYIIKGAWGLGAYKGVAERRLTGGRKYAPHGHGKDEKEKKRACYRKKEIEKRREKGERRITNGWALICAQREREGRKGEKRARKRKKEREKRSEKDERRMKTGQQKMKGGCTSANATERLRHTFSIITLFFSTARKFGANARFSPHLHNRLLFNALHQ